jgi:hypothetical protein
MTVLSVSSYSRFSWRRTLGIFGVVGFSVGAWVFLGVAVLGLALKIFGHHA